MCIGFFDELVQTCFPDKSQPKTVILLGAGEATKHSNHSTCVVPCQFCWCRVVIVNLWGHIILCILVGASLEVPRTKRPLRTFHACPSRASWKSAVGEFPQACRTTVSHKSVKSIT